MNRIMDTDRLRMLAQRREAAFEIIGLEKPDVDRVEEIIARFLAQMGSTEARCICPVVDIKITRREHVDESQMRTIADMLNAAVALQVGDEPGPALYGKHRDDCPCRPRSQRGLN